VIHPDGDRTGAAAKLGSVLLELVESSRVR
jgi:hypothetical protein